MSVQNRSAAEAPVATAISVVSGRIRRMCSIWAAGSKLVGHAVALVPSANSLNVRTSEAAMSSGAEGNSSARLRNTKRVAGPPIVTMRSRSRFKNIAFR